ncbi:hypothetical protein ABLW32_24020, partial [Salmonella enterica]
HHPPPTFYINRLPPRYTHQMTQSFTTRLPPFWGLFGGFFAEALHTAGELIGKPMRAEIFFDISEQRRVGKE